MSKASAAQPVTIISPPSLDKHKEHCFIVMPFGRDAAEQRWHNGWFKAVIEPVVRELKYDPILAAQEEKPNAINDEIREHLVYDPMVIADLGGMTPKDDPNPNVMYELGIRHAFDFPLVIMAWEDQQIPFDVGNQRALKQLRDLHDLEINRSKLKSFIEFAQKGEYYKPMEIVKRRAELEAATGTIPQDTLLRTILDEMKAMRGEISEIDSGQDALRREVAGKTAGFGFVRYGGLVQRGITPSDLSLGSMASGEWSGKLAESSPNLKNPSLGGLLNLDVDKITDIETLPDGSKIFKVKPLIRNPNEGGGSSPS